MAARLDDLLLLFIVIVSLPLATLLLGFNYAAVVVATQSGRLSLRRRQPAARKTILVTGTSNIQGLNVARALANAGHRIIGADLQSLGLLDVSRRSRALTRHYALPPLSAVADANYFARWLLEIVTKENTDLWIDCSRTIPLNVIALTRQKVEEKTDCACIAVDTNSSSIFADRTTLLEFFRDAGLPTPETHRIRSRGDIHNVLNHGQGQKQYVLDPPKKSKANAPQTLLPRRTLSQTYQDVSLVKITPGTDLILEEYLDVSTTYRCTAVAIRGSVEAFWVRQISSTGVNEGVGGPALHQALRSYTQAVVRELGRDFCSHLTLSFVLRENVTHVGVAQLIIPVEGSLRLDPDFVPIAGLPDSNSLVNAYLSMLQNISNGATASKGQNSQTSAMVNQLIKENRIPMTVANNSVLQLCQRLLLLRISPTEALGSVGFLLRRPLLGREAYYDFLDPVPAFWQYTVVFAWTVLIGTV